MEALKRDSETKIEAVIHKPVMLGEVLSLFGEVKKPSPLVLDCTLGAGGHAQAILGTSPAASYIGIDADPEAIQRSARRLSAFSDRLSLREGFFDEVLADFSAAMTEAATAAVTARPAGGPAFVPAAATSASKGFRRPDFVLFDLGLSSHQYLGSGRGFSFSSEESLDMRLSPRLEDSAADIVNRLPEDKLADLIYTYGEERYSRRIARAIGEARRNAPIRAAFLRFGDRQAVPPLSPRRIHPATRSFQAIRIAVQRELYGEKAALPLPPSSGAGDLVVIAFLPGDRNPSVLRSRKTQGFEELCRSPLVPSQKSAPPSRRPIRQAAGLEGRMNTRWEDSGSLMISPVSCMSWPQSPFCDLGRQAEAWSGSRRPGWRKTAASKRKSPGSPAGSASTPRPGAWGLKRLSPKTSSG